MSNHVFELHEIAVEYDGRTVLDVPHLEVNRGEILTLLGENGSGKTTLLRLLGLLIRPARGRVILDGEEVDFNSARHLLECRRRLSAVMQQPLLCRMSVRRNVALGLRFRRLQKAEITERVGTWLEKLSISHLADRSALKLSGGEAQRTSLARAMVIDPEAVFLDEPFAALDAPTRQTQLQEFRSVLSESGVTAVFATHDRGEAVALGDRVAVLMNGRIAQIDATDTVFSRPKRVDVARFLGVDTIVQGQVVSQKGELVDVDCGILQIVVESRTRPGENVYVVIRPEEIELSDEDSAGPDGSVNRLTGVVRRSIPTETHYRIEVDCGADVVALVSRARVRALGIVPGKTVQATFKPHAPHLITYGSQ